MPEWRAAVRQRLAALGLRPEREAEIVEELSQHLEDRCAALCAALGEEAAERAALAELDELAVASGEELAGTPAAGLAAAPGKDLARAPGAGAGAAAGRDLAGTAGRPPRAAEPGLAAALRAVESKRRERPALGAPRRASWRRLDLDVRYAVRALARQRGFTVVVTLTLALTLGATTAMFTVVDGVLLRAFPYPRIDRIVALSETTRHGDSMSVSWPNYVDWRDHNDVFESIGVFRGQTANLSGGDRPERLDASLASASLFQVLGLPAELGRSFGAAEDRPATERVALISDRLWRGRFAADPAVVGRVLDLDGEPHRVIGVMPAAMRFPSRSTDVWLPLGEFVDSFPKDRGNHPGLAALARLEPGVSVALARAHMDLLARQIERRNPDTNYDHTIAVDPFYEQTVSGVRPALLTLLGAVACVLLVGCANLANLMLARAEARRREIAVRTALGASRASIVQQLLAESVLLALLGGALGTALAAWCVRRFVASDPAGLPRIDLVGIDSRVLVFTILLALVVGLLFGLVPALHAAAGGSATALQEAGRGAGGGRGRLRSALVVAEVTLAFVLLAGAGLLIRSFARLLDVDPGFAPARVMTARFTLPAARYREQARWLAFHDELLRRVQSLPGVEVAALSSAVPMAGGAAESGVMAEGQPIGPHGPGTECMFETGTPGYLRAMGIRLLRGRAFTEHDRETSPPVAIVEEALVRKLFPGGDGLGKRIAFEASGQSLKEMKPIYREIVGVVRHVRHFGLTAEPPYLQLYVPLRQLPLWMQDRRPSMALVVRTALSPERLSAAMRRTMAALDPEIPLFGLQTMRAAIGQQTEQPRLSASLLAGFAGLAGLLAVLGIYGVLSCWVAERRHEIGVRMALGAGRAQVLRLVLGKGMRLTAAGLALGLGAALAASLALRTLLFGVGPHDPAVFALVTVLLAVAALAACYFPGRGASRLDPREALLYQ